MTLAGPVGLTGFYRDGLGLLLEGDAVRVGETRLRFTYREGSPHRGLRGGRVRRPLGARPVGERPALLGRLESIGLGLLRGTVDEPGRLAFVGERGRTFILAPPGRGWVPTGRPAEPHPVEAVLETPQPALFEL